jgi:hypothetical protein
MFHVLVVHIYFIAEAIRPDAGLVRGGTPIGSPAPEFHRNFLSAAGYFDVLTGLC